MNLCACGCGQEVIKRSNRYINGHNSRNRKCSGETKIKISDSRRGEKNPFFGKTHSKETLIKMQHTLFRSGHIPHNKGKQHSVETRIKISKKLKGRTSPNKGKNLSEEQKAKISDTLTGKFCGENHPFFGKKLLEHSGEKHWNWKGGIACEPYCDQWLDKDYKESIKKRDGYQCLNPLCQGNYKRLSLHHINYIKKDCRPFNLITLCISCNGKANKDREWHSAWYQAIIYNRYQRRI